MNIIPESCVSFYSADNLPAGGRINGSMMIPGIRQALDSLLNETSNTSGNRNPCMELIQRYLCNYYFPLCDLESGDIIPTCRRTCTLLFNNKTCSNLLMSASSTIEEQGIAVVPNDSLCESTFLPITEPSVADTCIKVEGRNRNYVAA